MNLVIDEEKINQLLSEETRIRSLDDRYRLVMNLLKDDMLYLKAALDHIHADIEHLKT